LKRSRQKLVAPLRILLAWTKEQWLLICHLLNLHLDRIPIQSVALGWE